MVDGGECAVTERALLLKDPEPRATQCDSYVDESTERRRQLLVEEQERRTARLALRRSSGVSLTTAGESHKRAEKIVIGGDDVQRDAGLLYGVADHHVLLNGSIKQAPTKFGVT
jgi:hypothetical protein